MADYASYKKINGDQIEAGTLGSAKFSESPTSGYGVKWFHGTPGACSSGCCCNWTVPSGISKLWIQAWGSGGNGSGACNCNRCHHYMGSGGGFFNSKMISTTSGCQYTVCASGVYRCYSRNCCGCIGCASYVNGYNLSNFCAIGGCRGMANTSWGTGCYTKWGCCLNPQNNGGDLTVGSMNGNWSTVRYDTYRGCCHCYPQGMAPSAAPFIGTHVHQTIRQCSIRCGCWTVPYGHGGQNAMTTCCGSGVCGQGGTGGGGLVKITYF